MICPITGILHDSCLASLKSVYFIKCFTNKDQYSLKYGFYIVISTFQRSFTSQFHLVPSIFRRKKPWCTVLGSLLTHQCTKYSKISVRNIAKRPKLIFLDVNGNFVLKFDLHIFAYQKKCCHITGR